MSHIASSEVFRASMSKPAFCHSLAPAMHRKAEVQRGRLWRTVDTKALAFLDMAHHATCKELRS